MRTVHIALVAVVLLALPAVAAEAASDAIAARLEQTTVELSLKDARLSAAVETLGKLTGLNFVVDPAVFDVKPDTDFRINLQLKDVKAMSALRLLLRMYSLAATFTDEVVLITRPDVVGEEPMTVVYEVFDMCELKQSRIEPRDVATGVPFRWHSSYTYIPPYYYFQYNQSYERYLDRYAEHPLIEPETLMKLIMTTVPANWNVDAGTGMGYANGVLVVRQNPSVQLEIAKLLYRLRMRQ